MILIMFRIRLQLTISLGGDIKVFTVVSKTLYHLDSWFISSFLMTILPLKLSLS